MLSMRETCRAQPHHRAQHGQRRRALLLDGRPISLQPLPQRRDALGVAAHADQRCVHVLGLDLIAQRQGDGAGDERGALSAAEGTQRRVLLVGVLGGAELVQKYVELVRAAIAQRDRVGIAAEVGVDGFAVASGKGGEHGLSGGDHFGVAGEAGAAEEEGFELGLEMVFVLGEGPAFGVGF